MVRYLIPLVIFVALGSFLYVGLGLNPTIVPSPLVGKPAPQFQLPQLRDSQSRFSAAQMQGQVWLLNVWASWCVSCRQEHPVLMQLARSKEVPI
jgi:cytochrome c biogenesis protein CcmG/thiol:disulfide interchange protein DsbE